MNPRYLKIFRVLIPSWGFFSDVADLPVLYLRTAGLSGGWGQWFPALCTPRRKLWSVLFNAEGNLYLAYNTLLQQIESDIADLSLEETEQFENSVSFRLLHNLVRHQLQVHDDLSQYQFRLERRKQGDVEVENGEIFLTSRTYSF
jgi:hypothetical protein